MNRAQALRLAIRALEYQRARYRVDANLATKCGADYPAARTALKIVEETTQAISILQQELDAHTRYPRQVKL